MTIGVTSAVFLGALAAAVPEPPAAGDGDVIYDFLKRGELGGRVGAAFNMTWPREDDARDYGEAWGLVELEYETASLEGFQAGVWALGVQKIWEQNKGDYDALFLHELDLRELYLSYGGDGSRVEAVAGRRGLFRAPSTDGDSHEGAQLHLVPLENLDFYGAAIHRWINNDRTSFDDKGITGWEDVGDLNREAGSGFYTFGLNWSIPDNASLLGYLNYQDDVMAVTGARGILGFPLSDDWRIGCDGIYAYHWNLFPDSVAPGYEDVQELLVHASVSWREICLGGGWYYLSDDRCDIIAGVFDSFDPMQDDDYYPLDELNDADEFFFDLVVELEPLRIETYYSFGRNHAHGVSTREFDLWVFWNITTALELGGYYIWTDYDGGDIPDYQRAGSSLAINF
ncbi:MAG TPA: hypothetical protein PLI51_06085 [bacterium]|nr:hypothetical protein [bacterium]HPQ66277.1 hypothetical protein [bacterium]